MRRFLQARGKSNRYSSKNSAQLQKRPDLLRGYILCAICGRRMSGETERGKRRIYRCPSHTSPDGRCGARRFPAELCEAVVRERISSILNDPEIIAGEVKRRRAGGPDEQLHADLENAKRGLARVENGQQRLVRRFCHATDDDLWPLIEREIAQAERGKARYNTMIGEIESRIAAHAAVVLNLESLSTYCSIVRGRLETFDFEEKRLALEALGARVTADDRGWWVDVSIPLKPAVGETANML